MSPANRVRLIVGVLAVLAAGIVVGVVYATRQSPSQPSARCKQTPSPWNADEERLRRSRRAEAEAGRRGS
jgi:hypothetical protein